MKPRLPFRLGSTSYVFPADILPNVRRLAPLVDDVELVLFEADDAGDRCSNLPTPEVIAELRSLAGTHDLTYTVHLPLDLNLASGDDAQRLASLEKACRVLRCTQPLDPWAYIVHLEGSDDTCGPLPSDRARWCRDAQHSLEALGREAGDLRLLAVENLEGYDPAIFFSLLDDLPVSLCVDVGHIIKRGGDPFPYLDEHLARTRVIHLHGCRDGRDHRGLDLLADGTLEHLLDTLLDRGYRGVLTLEVFTERHFVPGREMILSHMERQR